MAPEQDTPDGVRAVLARLDSLTAQKDVTVHDIVVAFGASALLPVMMVPALIVLSPLSGIPLLPTVFGTMIALIALQALFGRQGLWLPGVLMRRRIKGRHLHAALDRLHRVADWIDGHTRDRLRVFVSPPLDAVPKTLCAVCGAAMPLLELVPFSSSILAASVLLLATGLLVRDGLYAVCGAVLMAGALAIPVLIWGQLLRVAG